MKKLSAFAFIFLFGSLRIFSQVGLNKDGSRPDNSAMLDVKSTEMGLLFPRLSDAARNAIPSPATGLLIYNSSTNRLNYFNGSFWFEVEIAATSTVSGNLHPGGGISVSEYSAPADSSAMLDISSPGRGVLVPRTVPASVFTPARGLIIYNQSTNLIDYYDGTMWQELCSTSTGQAGGSGSQGTAGMTINTTGDAAHPSAILDVTSNDKGLLIPRLTNEQRNALLPVTGLTIYNLDSDRIEYWDGTGWQKLKVNLDCQEIPCGDTLVDPRDLQVYNTIKIGDQCWMAQNLNVGWFLPGFENMYDNGFIEVYCFNDDWINCNVYGGLYQWNEAVQYNNNPGVQGICPPGWHLPTTLEWDRLITALGGNSAAGGAMKSTGTIQGGTGLWNEPNTGATNSSGFTAHPGGYRHPDAFFGGLGLESSFWSSDEDGWALAWKQGLFFDQASIFNFNMDKNTGLPVRCIKGPPYVPTIPTVTTNPVSYITRNGAICGGNVTSRGAAEVTARGVCWGTSLNPTVSGNHTLEGTGTGYFYTDITGLSPNTLYHIRAYATNSLGIGYGEDLSFITLTDPILPSLYTHGGSNIAQTTVTSGGYLISDGGDLITERGICWSTMHDPATSGSHIIDESGNRNFTINITGLTANTPYFARAYAVNSAGIAYGNEVSLTTAFPCGDSITVNHVEGDIAPVTKTLTYGTVMNIPGDPSKCWINRNLGSDHKADSVNDPSEPSAGWYWQFNRRQGYMHDGVTLAPSAPWNYYFIDENFDWEASNDPCTSQLGSNWHIPTYSEWSNVDAAGNWDSWEASWDSPLKLHASGRIEPDGSLVKRGWDGNFWSSSQYYLYATNLANMLHLFYDTAGVDFSGCILGIFEKAVGGTVRCVNFTPVMLTAPSVTTDTIRNLTWVSATGGGDVTSDGGLWVNEKGICWDTVPLPDISGSHAHAAFGGNGTYTVNISGLGPNTHYYLRAYATNNVGTSYGEEVTFITLDGPILPVLTTTPCSNLTKTTVISGGSISCDGGEPVTARGVCWSTSPAPTIANDTTMNGTGTGAFTANLTSLVTNTRYYLRAYAVNSAGTAYGNEVTFTTQATVTTNEVAAINASVAVGGGQVEAGGGAEITARGVCWGLEQNPTLSGYYTSDSIGTGTFESTLCGLISNMTWYARAYVANAGGTSYGNQVRFVSVQPCPEIATVLYEGKTYHTVQIGTQCWLAENLDVGSQINSFNNQSDNDTIEKYCPGENPIYCDEYGGLYQWEEMMQYETTPGVTGICPPGGWHLPDSIEWTVLNNFLGGLSVSGGKMKETGIKHWSAGSAEATNSSGFTAFGAGWRNSSGGTASERNYGVFWSSLNTNSVYAYRQVLNYNGNNSTFDLANNSNGYSVRCVRDPNLPPAVPSDPDPADSAQRQPVFHGLFWACSDPENDPLSYDICFGTTNPPPLMEQELVDTSYSPGRLTLSTTYYWQVIARDPYTNVTPGPVWSFTTDWGCGDTIVDARDGKIYNTVLIGNQCWMAGNLNTGTMIPGSQEPLNDAVIQKYCYNDEQWKCDSLGGLYTWDEIMQYDTNRLIQGICPDGWHLPTAAEWSQMISALGGAANAGDSLRVGGPSGFEALMGGRRNTGSNFSDLGNGAWFWTSVNESGTARHYALSQVLPFADSGYSALNMGFSVRCVRGLAPIINPDVIIVDTLGYQLISDSAEQSQGIFRYIHADTSIVQAYDTGKIIIGMTGEGYLRKIDSLSFMTSILTLHTSQATLADVFEQAEFEVPLLGEISKSKGDDPELLNFHLENYPLIVLADLLLNISDVNIKLVGNPKLHYKKRRDHLIDDFGFTMNGYLQTEWTKEITTNRPLNISYSFYIPGLTFKKTIRRLVLGIPVWITWKSGMNAGLSVSVSTATNYSYRSINVNNFDFGIMHLNNEWSYCFTNEPTAEYQPIHADHITNSSVRFSFGPKTEAKLYGVIGLSAQYGPYDKHLIRYNSVNLDRNAEHHRGLDLNLSVPVGLFGVNVKLFQKSVFAKDTTIWQMPYRINEVSGNFQGGMPDQQLPQPIKVSVTDNNGNVPFPVIVHFEITQGGGTLTNYNVLTSSGFAETYWTLGSVAINNKLTVSCRKADGTPIDGSPVEFTALIYCTPGGIIEYEGQVYHTVKIASNCWMKENLNVGIPVSSSQGQHQNGTIEKYCFNDNPANCDVYGGLYQWDEMMKYIETPCPMYQGSWYQGICPPGWHVASVFDWENLVKYTLGGSNIAGGKMKEKGTAHWDSPNVGASDEYGFSARSIGDGEQGQWWSCSSDHTFGCYKALYTVIWHDQTVCYYDRSDYFQYAKSVRCIKDF